MDHAYIKEHSMVERYETGKLSSAESALFEEHFVDCPECQGHLQTTRELREALEAATSRGQLSAEFKPAARPDTFAWRRAFLAAAACAALLFVSMAFLTQQTLRLNRELIRARDDAGAWRQQYENQQQANTQLREQGQPAPGLPVVASVFPLNLTRGGQPADSEPDNRVVLSSSPQWMVLSLDLGGNDFESYRVMLKESSGQIVWKRESLAPAMSHTLSLALPSSLFHNGDYSLILEGLTRKGSYTAAGHYSFRVKK